ncbi:MAG: class I SAM-dependent methyltransferase [Clostridia bacterium]|nr:class I SAM-dependent methyltransferase [Clostridia bacterium]
MKGFWDADALRFMTDAAEHTPYYRELAAIIGGQLAPGGHVCDAGCGPGYLALELARYARRVTAVDISPEAADVLRRSCGLRGARNIDVRCGDIASIPPQEPYDAMVFCFFAGGEDGLRIARAQCRGDVFIVTRNYPAHRFSVRHHAMERRGYADSCRLLDGLGVPYEGKTYALDFSQPLRSMEDARRFFARYSVDDASEITDAFLRGRLSPYDKDGFAYIAEHVRGIGVIRLRAEDIPEGI